MAHASCPDQNTNINKYPTFIIYILCCVITLAHILYSMLSADLIQPR